MNAIDLGPLHQHAGTAFDELPGRHPFTPEALPSSKDPFGILCWSNSPYCGIKRGEFEIGMRIEEVEGVTVSFRTPAKGAGMISLCVEGKDARTLYQTTKYDEKAYQWFYNVALQLEQVFEAPLLVYDQGADC